MTRDELIAALAPSRLPPTMLDLDWREGLALFALGLLAGLAVAALAAPLLTRRLPLRQRIRATRGLPPQERLLAIARILGHLPAPLRPAAYGAEPAPPDLVIERLARRRVRGAR